MSRNWTIAQQKAINELNKTLLVSAAAGSGKTATLTERIIRSVTDPNVKADLSRMLIVTYTRAAAFELRSRISVALSDALAEDPSNVHLATQSLRLQNAQIATVHRFCLNVIRENFADFGVSAHIHVADTSEAKVLRRDIMQELLEECYSGICKSVNCSSAEFCKVADNLSTIQKAESLADGLLNLYAKMESASSPAEQMRQCADSYFACCENYRDSRFYKAMLQRIDTELEHYEKRLSYVLENYCLLSDDAVQTNYFKHEVEFAAQLRNAFTQGLDELRNVALTYSQPKAKNVAENDYKKLIYSTRNGFKKFVLKLPERINSITVGMESDIAFEIGKIASVTGDIFEEFAKRMWEEKKRRSICEFSDLEQLMLQKLVVNGEKSDFARQISEKFDYIYVDEYQDINSVQNAIFEAISKPNNLFMVGDVKQSIYSFQGGDPKIFADLKNVTGDFRETIHMAENFRCDSTVTDFVNSIFEKLMPIGSPSLRYVPEEDNLIPAKDPMPPEGHKCKVVLIQKSKAKGNKDQDDDDEAQDDDEVKRDPEAEWVADEILRLVNGELKNDGTPIRYGDIAILLRSVKNQHAQKYVKALENRGIPSYTRAKRRLLEAPEVVIITNLLTAIDNPYRDVALVGAMQSPLFSFTMDDLIIIRGEGEKGEPFYRSLLKYCETHRDYDKGRRFIDALQEYRRYAASVPVDKLIRYIYKTTGIYAFAAEKQQKTNLNLLSEAARKFEGGSFKGLYNFIQYITETTVNDGELDGAASFSGGLDAVSIVTMHSSKGLEYPICFVSGCNEKKANRDKVNVLYDHSLGISLKLLDNSGHVRYDNPWYNELEKSIGGADCEERFRLLYVALTRARERLYVTAGDFSDNLLSDMAVERKCPTRFSLISLYGFIKLILATADPACYELVKVFSETENTEQLEQAEQKATVYGEEAQYISDQILKNIEYEYPQKALTKLPTKLAVSKLFPDMLDGVESGETTLDDIRLPKMKKLKELSENSVASASVRGTATHAFLQFCDFEAAKADIETEILRLVSKGFIPKQYADIICKEQLNSFFDSEFYLRMQNSDKLYREFRFNLKLPSDTFTSDFELKEVLEGQELLVQGVVDCFFEEDGEIVVVDYKTDYLSEYELENPEVAAQKLVSRHATQLLYYAEACKRICNKPIRDVYIYSLPAGRAFSLSQTPMPLNKFTETLQ